MRDADASTHAACRRRGARRRRVPRTAGVTPERRAHAGLALHGDLAAHRFDQPTRDREPQAGAAVASRGRVIRLREAIRRCAPWPRGAMPMPESLIAISSQRARCRISRTRASTSTSPRFGELDGVADQVRQHLSQPRRDRRAITRGSAGSISVATSTRFAARGTRKQRGGLFDQHRQRPHRSVRASAARPRSSRSRARR